MDQVLLREGKLLEGLIEQQSDQSLQLLEIRRAKGNTLYGVYRPVQRSEIVRIVPISDADRQQTRRRFDEYRNRVRIEASQMENLQVNRDGHRLRYQGDCFTLESTAPQEIVRRSIVRVQQIFAAMRQMIPARHDPERPIVIRLFGSRGEYNHFLQQSGLPIANPAVFHRQTNTIALGDDLQRLANQLQRIQSQHDSKRAELERARAELPTRLEENKQALAKSPGSFAEKQKAARRFANDLQEDLKAREKQLDQLQRQNDAEFAQATARMFARLYHEALHAYLENFVYPGTQHDVPRWLHEGLAQIFESSTLDGQTFYVAAPHEESLKRLQSSLAKVSLADLLTADAANFLVAHGENPHASQLHYAAAWGLAHYLTFERHRVGSLAMDRYVALDQGIDSPISRFEQLVQTPLAAFEDQWRGYIQSLRAAR